MEIIIIVALGVGAACLGMICLVLQKKSAELAAQMKNDEGRLAAAVSAMAEGKFVNESALAQLVAVQKDFAKDIDAFARGQMLGDGNLLDEKKYAGCYRDMILGINKAAEKHIDSAATIESAIKSLANGESVRVPAVLEDLRKKIDEMNRELQVANSAAESAKNDAEKAREEAASVKRELVTVREAESAARREASAAANEAAAARREASTARREADRATTLRPPTTTTTPRAVPPRPMVAPAPSVPRPSVAVEKLPSHNSSPAPAIKSLKIEAPCGAHEYDSKDFGKF